MSNTRLMEGVFFRNKVSIRQFKNLWTGDDSRMITLITRRIPSLFVVLLGVTVISFALSNISRIDPAEALAYRVMRNPSPEMIEEIRADMGLHLPVYRQYIHWLGNCLRGDLGTSLLTKNPVASDLADKLPETLKLVGMALVWIVLSFIPVSLVSAVRKNGFFDHTVRGLTILGVSVPNFWLGFLFLLLFAVTFPIFKVVDYGSVKSLILPSLVLAIPTASSFTRIFRATLLSNLNKDYVVYARARGLSEVRIICAHVLKNSLPPMITLLCQYMGLMLAGSAVVESVFSMKGLGNHLLEAVMARDLPTINGFVLLTAVVFVICGTLADILNALLNPCLRSEGTAL
jgi:ABC-type dipeptide/oligopeptide/nickel transport system permease component